MLELLAVVQMEHKLKHCIMLGLGKLWQMQARGRQKRTIFFLVNILGLTSLYTYLSTCSRFLSFLPFLSCMDGNKNPIFVFTILEGSRALTHTFVETEKRVRDKGFRMLSSWLQKQNELSELDWAKLWKGLFYCECTWRYFFFCATLSHSHTLSQKRLLDE